MIGEIDFYGIYLPAVLPLMLLALAVTGALRYTLARLGAYRAIWHRSLFNLALYLIVLGATVALS